MLNWIEHKMFIHFNMVNIFHEYLTYSTKFTKEIEKKTSNALIVIKCIKRLIYVDYNTYTASE